MKRRFKLTELLVFTVLFNRQFQTGILQCIKLTTAQYALIFCAFSCPYKIIVK